MNQKKDVFCLCYRCVGAFFETNQYRITRADPLEVIKGTCDYCQVRPGFDFVVERRPRNMPYRTNTIYAGRYQNAVDRTV